MNNAFNLTAVLVLGGLSLILSGVIFLLISPYLFSAAIHISLLALFYVAVWGSLYVAMVIGAAVISWFRPMEVKKKGSYTIEQVKEAGKRSKK